MPHDLPVSSYVGERMNGETGKPGRETGHGSVPRTEPYRVTDAAVLTRVRQAVAALEPHTADTTDTARGVAFARDIIRLALGDVS